MTQHAHLDAAPGTAMRRELIVALVAALGGDDIAHERNSRSVGHEIKDGACVISTEVELGQIAGSVDANCMGGGLVETGRSTGRKGVAVFVIGGREDTIRFGSSLGHCAGN